jgi:phosphatidylserine decarboxylase
VDVAQDRKASLSQAALRWGPAGVYSRVVGAMSRATIPTAMRGPAIGAFARLVGADAGEAELPPVAYPTLGEFFARRLRGDARPVASSAVVAPCDGVVSAVGEVGTHPGQLMAAKDQYFSLADLLASHDLAADLQGGRYATIYLSPRDYHRVHTPVAGHLEHYEYVPGARWPVGMAFVSRVPGLYARNERAIAVLRLPDGGRAAIVLVAAIGVGNLHLSHWRQPGGVGHDSRDLRAAGVAQRLPAAADLQAGDELGAFLLGSTVIMVLPKGSPALDLTVGQVVRCGQAVAPSQQARPA